MTNFFQILDLIGVAVFAASGALVASRKEMDPIGFILMASVTAVGGGTLRDLILGRTIFWIEDQSYLIVCLGVAFICFVAAHLIQRRYVVLLWLDAIGLSAYGVLGAELALKAGAAPLPAIALGMMTATFGGLIRDVITYETPLILKKEIYATAALSAASLYLFLVYLSVPALYAALCGFIIGLVLRAGGILFGWSLPRYKPREGREYQ